MNGWRTILVVLLLGASGCIEREGRPVNPCTSAILAQSITWDAVEKVDLLFLVDNSGSMAQEQASLAEELPRMIQVLASGDFELDGDLTGPNDFEPVLDLNVGIITSDMGTGGFEVPTCARSDFGEDGILRGQGRTDLGCAATFPNILNFLDGSGVTPVAFASDVACVSTVGTTGCGFEQQLEAVLKALTPASRTSWTAESYTPLTFFRNTAGHGSDANAGFVRDGSVLAIIPLTDENDCSALDPTLFDRDSPTYSGTDLNLRCWAHGATALHPISRYVEGLLRLRRREGLLVYAPISGIPVDLAQQGDEEIDWDALLGDARMVQRPDPANPGALVPSCNEPGVGTAFPPTRLIEVARDLDARGAGVTVQSICQESFTAALSQIIRMIAQALVANCMPRELNRGADGTVACGITTLMPEGIGCDELPGASAQLDAAGAPQRERGRALCTIPQVVGRGAVPAGEGWYYDDFSEDVSQCGPGQRQRIAFTVRPPPGSEVRLACFQSVEDTTAGTVGVGTFCDPGPPPFTLAGPPCDTGTSLGGVQLGCDPVTRACAVPCDTDARCREAGLVGFECDARPLNLVDPILESAAPHGFCVNPTCG